MLSFISARKSAVLWLALLLLLAEVTFGFRILEPGSRTPNGTYFKPYDRGFVGIYGDPTNYQRERINEGAFETSDQELLYEGVSPRQSCPGMVGPFSDGNFYCTAREFGYCDRRSGTCFCNTGYAGIDCTQCSDSHFPVGTICSPKKLCPNDCSGSGVCNFNNGTCSCLPHRAGVQCETLLCSIHNILCETCTEKECLKCASGYYLTGTSQVCGSCFDFDPRCAGCTLEQGCTVCADSTLTSVRRSGYRASDPDLPTEEVVREFGITLPFGTKSPESFADAENYFVSTTPDNALKDNAITCTQGNHNDERWDCEKFNTSHIVCGHFGVFTFVYPNYAVSEKDTTIQMQVRRTGGGHGNVDINYYIKHFTTNDSDVIATAPYTTVQRLSFEDGVIERSFLVTILDDNIVEEDEVFQVVLEVPEGGGSVGAQFRTNVTIIDNDRDLLSPKLTKSYENTTQARAGQPFTTTVHAVAATGKPMTLGGDRFFAVIENNVKQWQKPPTRSGSQRNALRQVCNVTDMGYGTYKITSPGIKEQGVYQLRIWHAFPASIRGEYFYDGFFERLAVQRLDHKVNFTWGAGNLIPRGSDYISVRWSGAILPPVSGPYQFKVDADDHARLWIDGELILDHWHERYVNLEPSRFLQLTADKLYEVVLEYREVRGEAYARLMWGYNGENATVIPQANLFSLFEIDRSPVLVTIQSADTTAATTECTGEGLYGAVALRRSEFTVCPRDQFRNLRDDDDDLYLSTQRFSSVLHLLDDRGHAGVGAETLTPTMTYNRDTFCYDFAYTPERAGDYSLQIFFRTNRGANATEVAGSPFLLTVEVERFSGPKSLVQGLPMPLYAEAGSCKNFTVVARDNAENLIFYGGVGIQAYMYRVDYYNVTPGLPNPNGNPTVMPTATPTCTPSLIPTSSPTAKPSAQPTAPTPAPTSLPTTRAPTAVPTARPSTAGPTSGAPTAFPTRAPTSQPTFKPSITPTAAPTPSPAPTRNPTTMPTFKPSTAHPSASPTSGAPTAKPTSRTPTTSPTRVPTARPSSRTPTAAPSRVPTAAPSTAKPTFTAAPTLAPTATPSARPTTFSPTARPTSAKPSLNPTASPTARPSTASPTPLPSTFKPTANPTTLPSITPTTIPTARPTVIPTAPTAKPTAMPTYVPTARPSMPTCKPTANPTFTPTPRPTAIPTAPTPRPSNAPSQNPSCKPTFAPSMPTAKPTPAPTSPTAIPTAIPTAPTAIPSVMPTAPTRAPSAYPSFIPTPSPSEIPSPVPSAIPSTITPTAIPTTESPTVTATAAPTTIRNLFVDFVSPGSDSGLDVVRDGDVVDLGNGQYMVQVCPVIAGVYEIHILVNGRGVSNQPHRVLAYGFSEFEQSGRGRYYGQYIADSPYKLVVSHTVSSAITSTAVGPGLISAVVGVPVSFMVTVRDAYDNVLRTTNPPNVLTAKLNRSPQAVVNIWNYYNGSYNVEYIPLLSGPNLISVYVDGVQIKDSPFTVPVQDGRTSAAYSFAVGQGLHNGRTGDISYFEVYAFDLSNNRKTDYQDIYSFDVQGANTLLGEVMLPCPSPPEPGHPVCDVDDRLGGHYYGYFRPLYSGVITVSVYLQRNNSVRQELYNSPFTAVIVPSAPKAENSDVTGTLYDNVAGVPTTVSLQLRDYFNNKLITGGRNIELALLGVGVEWGTIQPLPIEQGLPNQHLYKGFYEGFPDVYGTLTDRQDGTYMFDYTVPAAGQYVLRLSLAEDGLNASYFNGTDFGRLVDQDFNYHSFEASQQGRAVNIRTSKSWTGDLGRRPGVRGDLGEGTYLNRFQTRAEQNISVDLRGIDMNEYLGNTNYSRYKFRDEFWSATWTGMITPEFAEVYTFTAEVDSDSSLTLRVGGRGLEFNNTSPGTLVLNISDAASDWSGQYNFTDIRYREFEVRYAHFTGDAVLRLYWESLSTPRRLIPTTAFTHWRNVSHFNNTIHPAPLCSHCSTAYGDALEHAQVAVKKSFWVYARDEFSNLLQVGGHQPTMVAVGKDGVAFRGDVTDYCNSTYLIEYYPTQAGEFRMYVSIGCCAPHPNIGITAELEALGPLLIKGAPFLLTIVPAPVEQARTVALGRGLLGGTAGDILSFTMLYRDIHNNPTTAKNASETAVSIRFEEQSSTADILTPTSLATVFAPENTTATYRIDKAGKYLMYVSLKADKLGSKSKQIIASPFQITVYPSKADPSLTVCRGVGLRQATANRSAHFEIQLYDTFKNNLITGGNRFYVRLEGDASFQHLRQDVIPVCQDTQNGRTTCTYTAAHARAHQLTIRLLNNSLTQPGGLGLTATYYTNADAATDGRMQPTYMRVDPTVQFVWPHGQLIPSEHLPAGAVVPVTSGGQSVRWDGYLVSPRDDTFHIVARTSHLNASVYLDDVLVFDSLAEISAPVVLVQDSAYRIRIIASVATRSAEVERAIDLRWSTATVREYPIPRFFLYDSATDIALSPFPVKVAP